MTRRHRGLAHHCFTGRPCDVRIPHDGDHAEHRAADGGKTEVYMFRWVNTFRGRGEEGLWSEVAAATVAA